MVPPKAHTTIYTQDSPSQGNKILSNHNLITSVFMTKERTICVCRKKTYEYSKHTTCMLRNKTRS